MSTLGTAVIAFLSAFGGAALNLGLVSWNRIDEARSIAAILAAEIAATLSIAKQRRYTEITRDQIAALASGQDTPLFDFIQNAETLDLAYRSAVTGFKLGLVGPELAGLVTKFFRQLYAIMGDVKRYGGGEVQLSLTGKRALLEEGLQIWEQAEKDGTKAIEGLNAFASQGPARHLLNSVLNGRRGQPRPR